MHVPIPPSLNAMYQRTRRGVALTDEARCFKNAVAWEARATWGGTPALPKLLAVEIALTVRRLDRLDLDNGAKLVCDGLAVGLGFNDCRVTELRMTKTVQADAVPVCVVRLLAAENE